MINKNLIKKVLKKNESIVNIGMKKFRVGLIIDNFKVSHNVSELVNFIDNEQSFDKPVLITGYKKNLPKTFWQKIIKIFKQKPLKIIDTIINILIYKLIVKIELSGAIKNFPNYLRKIDLENNNNFEILLVNGKWSKSGTFLDFTNEDILQIIKNDFDCLIRCGSGILKGEILNSSKFGVISFHHGDNRVNRGGPCGLWEVLNGEPSSGFVIQKINNELDGGEVLVRGNLMTLGSWHINKAQLIEKSSIFLMRFLKKLSEEKRLPEIEGIRLHGNKLYKIESSKVMLKYVLKNYVPRFLNKLSDIIISPKIIRWSVAYAQHNNFSKSLWRYQEIPNPKGRFLADPSVFRYDDCDYIFVEDFFYSDRKGRISVIKIKNEQHDFLGIVLEEDFHLSFPFVFSHNNEIYMIPESSKNKDIRLYKCQKFPDKWVLDAILMSNISAADTMVFFQNKKWFMLTNICSSGLGDHQSELHVFFSDDLKSNNWKPITSGNPVIFDSLCSRNGGLFSHKGATYRVNQIHGKKHYGKSFGINKINNISEHEFTEERVSEIGANFKKEIISTHGFSANEHIAAVDYARLERLKNN